MSTPEIGFAIVSHDRPAQLARLVQALRRVYGPVPIACHHDFSQSRIPAPLGEALKDVRFVRPHVRTSWATFSVVEASALAMSALMCDGPAPHWGVLLTGADYPLAPSSRVLNDLNSAPVDAWIEYRRMDPDHVEPSDAAIDRAPSHPRGYPIGEGARNHRICIQRYFGTPMALTWPRRGTSSHRFFRHFPFITDKPLPFRADYPCFVGSAYFSFTAKANERIQRAVTADSAMRNWYRDRFAPDESFPHTVLANDNQLVLGNASWRYVDWSTARRHPKVLEESDVPAAMGSGMHFARKVDTKRSAGYMNAIDTVLKDARHLASEPT